MVGYYNKSVVLTYIGIVFAVIGIACTFQAKVNTAMLCLAICGVCDLFDGPIARLCKRSDEEKEFGVQIDSLADLAAFGVLPVAILFSIEHSFWQIGAAAVYLLAAISRLAYFNVHANQSAEAGKFYMGLPVTYSALIFPVLWLIRFAIPENFGGIIFTVVMVIVALLYQLRVKFHKPGGIAYIFLGILAAGVIASLIVLGG